MQIGICGIDHAQAARDAGFDYIEPAAARHLMPGADDAEWAPLRDQLLALPLPVRACNLFLAGEAKLFGPRRDLHRLADYADTLFSRLAEVGGKVQVFGSGKARTPPQGYSPERAMDELKEATAAVAPAAEAHGIVIAMEHLRQAECGLLNTLAETARFVRQVNHPAVRLLADSFHLVQMNEPVEAIRDCGDLLVHVHVADGPTRHEPAAAGTDLRPLFRELKAVGYDGGISLECAWQDIDANLKPTRDLVAAQWAEA
ncbi:MAG: TIM barrel protein [Anaerolineaceae bacterium]|nr:TIM barrel protein [Anaerolineaceae bacterium]